MSFDIVRDVLPLDCPDEISLAAASMRQSHLEGHPRHLFWSALADWLESVGQSWGEPGLINAHDKRHAMALATTYLEAEE